MRHAGFVDGSISMTGVASEQPGLWQDRVLLNEEFYRALREHPVPVSESALRVIGPRSMVIDVYIWLAYRMNVIEEPSPISWPALFAQFGPNFTKISHFKPTFLDALRLATTVYPEARVQVDQQKGVVLLPSRPAIPRKDRGRLLAAD